MIRDANLIRDSSIHHLNSLQNFIKTRVDAWGTQSDCVELVQVEHVDQHVDVQICPEDLKSFED